MENLLIKGKEVVADKLLAFGFQLSANEYSYQEKILDGQFDVLVTIKKDGQLNGRVIDLDMEEYTAFRVANATGNFVGQVREAYLSVLEKIVASCYIDSPFQSRQANELSRKLKETFADEPDLPFEKWSDVFSFRAPVNRKWYALLFPLNRQKLDAKASDEKVDVINIKVDPTEMDTLLSLEGVYPSYHMSKKSWVSIVLDGSLSDEMIWELVVKSRQLVAPKGYQVEGEPDYWIIPANPKYYDIEAEFAESRDILWTQKAAIKQGDFVVIYVTAPDRCLRYFCQVLQADLPNDGYRDRCDIKKLMELRLLTTFDKTTFPIARMSELGVTTVRGPRRVTKALHDALKEKLIELGIY